MEDWGGERVGSGRKGLSEKEWSERIGASVTESTAAALRERAAADGSSVSAVVRRAVLAYLADADAQARAERAEAERDEAKRKFKEALHSAIESGASVAKAEARADELAGELARERERADAAEARLARIRAAIENVK